MSRVLSKVLGTVFGDIKNCNVSEKLTINLSNDLAISDQTKMRVEKRGKMKQVNLNFHLK